MPRMWEQSGAVHAEPTPAEAAAVERRAAVAAARVRACAALGAFAGGLMLGQAGVPGTGAGWCAGAAALLVVGALARGAAVRVALLAALVALGVGWHGVRVGELPRGAMMRLADEQGAPVPVVVEGVVLTRPDEVRTTTETAAGPRAQRSTRFELAVRSVLADTGEINARGTLHVVVRERVGALEAQGSLVGTVVRVRGTWLPVPPMRNPGQRDGRALAAMEGRAGTLIVESAGLVARVDGAAASPAARAHGAWLRSVAGLRSSARAWLAEALPDGDDAVARHGPERALLGALLIGEEGEALGPLNARLARLGVVHVLSISGFHLVVMTGVVLGLVRLTGDHGRLEPLLAGLFVILYVLIVPAGAPIARSAAMVLALLAADIAGRRYDRLTILLWTALAVLVWRPLDLWSAGAQLSFGVTAALIGLGPRFHARLWGTPLRGLVRGRGVGALVWRGGLAWLRAALSASLLCWAVSAPVVLFHTGLVSPWAALTGVPLTVLFSTLLIVGFVALLLAAALGPLLGAAAAAGAALTWLAEAATEATGWLDGLPGMAWYLPAVSGLWTIGATVVIAWWCGWASRTSARAWWVAAAACAWLAVEVLLPLRGIGAGGLRIDPVITGEHHPALVRGGGQTVLWLGSTGHGASSAGAIVRAARALGAWPVERVIVAGGSARHAAALGGVLRPLGVREVLAHPHAYDLWRSDPSSAAAQALGAADRAGVRIARLEPLARVHVGVAHIVCEPEPWAAAWTSCTVVWAGERVATLRALPGRD